MLGRAREGAAHVAKRARRVALIRPRPSAPAPGPVDDNNLPALHLAAAQLILVRPPTT